MLYLPPFFFCSDNPKYVSSLGQTILNVARIVPDGLLVFFPSYPMLNKCVDAWQASGLWADISCKKPIFLEPRSKDQFTSTMEEFYQAIRDSKGAVFMAVCRGKVSEGLDFADRNGRAVIITGLPFPPLKDPKVILKRRYLEANRTRENQLLSGQEWYNLDATRAVNQAIGRVIRHRNDYGAILLCDSRFKDASQVQQLSAKNGRSKPHRPLSSPVDDVFREMQSIEKNVDLEKVEERETRSKSESFSETRDETTAATGNAKKACTSVRCITKSRMSWKRSGTRFSILTLRLGETNRVPQKRRQSICSS
ncbi:GD16747 [Drosophila simulans]|uniref:Regulator of telomere elongation helicase 1 homolog n=1 Tax=Drosophila simulans TaxID=7240 RepID=B4R522_DROSI|nr:GD16747 [Drosophila simulans]